MPCPYYSASPWMGGVRKTQRLRQSRRDFLPVALEFIPALPGSTFHGRLLERPMGRTLRYRPTAHSG